MAAEQLTDKENQFRKRARRRLVGAVALVLLMVTVLPMVLDDRSGQKTSQPEIAISIPSQDGTDFASKIVPVAPASQTPPVQMASPVEKPQPAVTPVQPAAESKAPEIVKPATVVKPVEQVLPVEEKPVTSSVKTAPEVARAVNDTKEKAALPPAEIKPKSQPVVTPKKGSFLVQIGVFSDAAKVKQLRARIAEKGIQCYTEDMNTSKGIKIRLRCGPFAARAEAQQALETLKTAGFGGMLVTNQ